MRVVVPFKKDIEFPSKIAEISSISLEHELDTTNEDITGNFIISGEYKSNSISVNKESFLYKLPFNVDITDNIDRDSIDFSITDFTYEIADNLLKVNIEFMVNAKEIEENNYVEEVEDLLNIEEDRNCESEEIILNAPDLSDNEYVSYHIHIVSDVDTIDSICNMYQTDINTLKEYNTIDNLNVGDKVIIPCLDE